MGQRNAMHPHEQVLGAAAKDPTLQAAANEAAMHPSVQAAAWNQASTAARQGAGSAKADLLEVRTYIQKSHCSVRILCFCIALALLVSSFLGIFNIFNAAFSPLLYLFAVYNTCFAAAILIMDGKPEWYARCWDIQTKLFDAAPCLGSQAGRAVLYFYVGSINLLMLPHSFLWKAIYIGIGGSLCAAGVLMLLQQCGCCGQQRESPESQCGATMGP